MVVVLEEDEMFLTNMKLIGLLFEDMKSLTLVSHCLKYHIVPPSYE